LVIKALDPYWIWIRIRNPDPDPYWSPTSHSGSGSGSGSGKNEYGSTTLKRNQIRSERWIEHNRVERKHGTVGKKNAGKE